MRTLFQKPTQYLGKKAVSLQRLLVVITSWIGTGCGVLNPCAISGDNLKGRLNFSSTVSPNTSARLVVQYAADANFTTIISSTIKSNPHGIVSMPYSFCVTEGVNYYLRAFQDTTGTGTYTTGQGSGRYDGTDTGNATPTAVNIPVSTNTANPNTKTDVNIALDSITGI